MDKLPYPNLKGVNRFAAILVNMRSHRHGNGPQWVLFKDAVELYHALEKEEKGNE